jgi:AraC-like DNA-binding protein
VASLGFTAERRWRPAVVPASKDLERRRVQRTQLRVEEAKWRLERTHAPVDEISWKVGYEDPAFFAGYSSGSRA